MEVDQIAQTKEFFICTTNLSVKLFTKDWELKQTLNGSYSLFKCGKDNLITVEQNKVT